MSSEEIAIGVRNLSKCYHIYNAPHDRLKQFVVPRLYRSIPFVRRCFPSSATFPNFYNEFWALRNVSFEIKKGETVGIVGRNGSGKSTLLQLICGTLHQTSGSIENNGRIAALLELGAGFNPEFTGRENVFMNSAVLGLSEQQITNRFDEIAAFADIGQFIEQPVKTYSSGMLVRLAFAVAIHVDPEILIVDEALSVGDESFQRKCFARIEAIKRGGATILFVSHSGATIVELCDRAILLDGGEKIADGLPKRIVGVYQKLLYAPIDRQVVLRAQLRQANEMVEGPADNAARGPGPEGDGGAEAIGEWQESFDPKLKPNSTIEYESHGAYIESPVVLTLAGEQVNNLIQGRVYRYAYSVKFTKSASNVRFGMLIKTISGMELGGAAAKASPGGLAYVEAGSVFRVEFRFNCMLNPNVYFLNAGVDGVVNGRQTYLHRLIDVAMFRVQPGPESFATGIVDFGCQLEFELI